MMSIVTMTTTMMIMMVMIFFVLDRDVCAVSDWSRQVTSSDLGLQNATNHRFRAGPHRLRVDGGAGRK